MSRLLPFRADDTPTPGEQAPRVVDLEGDDADKVFSALSSDTARRIYTCLNEEPRTPSDVAEAIDSSIQNVRYHLEKLEDAGLIDVVDVWYSSRGNEMNVYAPTSGPLIVSGDEQRASRLRGALARFLGGVGALAAGSLFVQYALPRLLGGPTNIGSGGDSGGAGGGDTNSSMGGGSADEAATASTSTVSDASTGGGGGGGPSVNNVDGTSTSAAQATQTQATQSGAEATQAATEAPTGAQDTTHQTVTEAGKAIADGGVQTTQQAADAASSGTDAVLSTIPPGALFFAGGLCVLLVVTGFWYFSSASR
ncbi:ArsR/SmtB family transcription factor [Haloarchaeobius sp. DFWS5]|uniref:ArsR/SmtB family transcription factor n=1 Tax=Haloarchaeobius sp. DFWS5 TaxID=3446114 RepID=UPI003EBFA1D2